MSKDNRKTPLNLEAESFKKLGYQLIDQIAELLNSFDSRPITPPSIAEEWNTLIEPRPLPEIGESAEELLTRATKLLLDNSLYNGHPKFMGYITGSPAPIGMLGDLLAAAVNPNVGAQILSPAATEIEKQTVGWLAEFIGYKNNCGGILVSGGNMANFTGFLAGRAAKAPKDFKEKGFAGLEKEMIIYCSAATHTWVEKAAVLFGHGLNAVRWIPTDDANRMDITLLQAAIQKDLDTGNQPIMVIGTAGDVSTGVVDDLQAIAQVAQEHQLWFHVDGAYGIPAAVIPEMKNTFTGIEDADSIALDPHKWLYCPLEAGCTLVKDPQHLLNAFSSHPAYYNFDQGGDTHNFYEYGLQNSRGFRALKVWLALQQVGRDEYEKLIKEDIELAKYMYDLTYAHAELEAITHNLSITTFRYVPVEPQEETYLNQINETLLDDLQAGGEVFLSNAIVDDRYALRACIVNFRTSQKDIEEIIDIVVREGRRLHETS